MLRFIVVALVFLSANITRAITIDEIIANNLDARGGKKGLEALTSLKVTGTLTLQGMEATFTQHYKGGNKLRMDLVLMGQSVVTAYDGAIAWANGPFTGGKPKLANDDETRRAKDEADFTGNFIRSDEKGLTITLEGTEDVNGSTAYKIKVVRKDSSVTTTFIDAITWLEIQHVDQVQTPTAAISVVKKVSDYKPVNGILFPMTTSVSYNGDEMMAMKWETVETNVPIDDAIFAFPAPPEGE